PLPEPHDVELLALRVVPIPGLILRDEVFVSPGCDRAAHATDIHLRTRVEQVRQILHANAIPKSNRARAFSVLPLFITRSYLCNFLEQFGQGDNVLVDEHSGCGPDPASVVRETIVERQTQIVVTPAAPLLGIPY